ncbi:hypothetical protein KAH94_02400 [bacterium]|nr:hypothetical protein [bacterium]
MMTKYTSKTTLILTTTLLTLAINLNCMYDVDTIKKINYNKKLEITLKKAYNLELITKIKLINTPNDTLGEKYLDLKACIEIVEFEKENQKESTHTKIFGNCILGQLGFIACLNKQEIINYLKEKLDSIAPSLITYNSNYINNFFQYLQKRNSLTKLSPWILTGFGSAFLAFAIYKIIKLNHQLHKNYLPRKRAKKLCAQLNKTVQELQNTLNAF